MVSHHLLHSFQTTQVLFDGGFHPYETNEWETEMLWGPGMRIYAWKKRDLTSRLSVFMNFGTLFKRKLYLKNHPGIAACSRCMIDCLFYYTWADDGHDRRS